MDELTKATNLKREIDHLESRIKYLKSLLAKAFEEKKKVGMKFEFDPKEIAEPLEPNQIEFYSMEGFKVPETFKADLVLEDSEFIVVIGTLINFKIAKKEQLVKQFNTLKIKIKL